MVVKYTTDQEDRNNQAARIGRIFDLPDAGAKVSTDGWTMTHTPESDSVRLTVELVAFISVEEAEKILNRTPLEGT